MKALFSILTAGLMALAAPFAAYGQALTHQASGVVKKVDRENGKVTLAHGPVKTLNWPGMVMPFVIEDKKLFEGLAAEKKVDFEFVQRGNKYVITSIK